MELYDHDFLEELLSLRRETRNTNNNNPCSEEENHQNLLSSNNGWSNNSFDSSFDQNSPYSSSLIQNSYNTCQEIPQSNYNYNNNDHHYTFNEIYCSLLEEFSATPQIIDHSSSSYNTTPPSFLAQEDYYCDPFSMNMEEDENPSGLFGEEELQNTTVCKVEQSQSPEEVVPVFNSTNGTICMERKNIAKKMQGKPSKNLMAERRRRKRLNDRLSMLRSIVPKISKMDRTSILGDTIDYMKELLEKINSLKQEIEVDSNEILNDVVKPNDMLVRNSPKFDIERRKSNTRVEICCAGKPGLLLSTVNTLEALGLEIQQCVISCFNDFTMHASCSEELEHKTILSAEDVKQALFRSAGYGGRCL